jgi:Lrp/AsnC family transcriptional regulator, regulator for asnA, asnC and gidA
MEIFELDYINKEIIKLLNEDARTPFSELAKQLKISNSLVHQRIKKMQDAGIIKGYSINIDLKKMGNESFTFTGVVTKEARYVYSIVEELKKIPAVIECHLVSGKYALLLKIIAKNNDDLRVILHEQIHAIEGVGSTDSFISFGEAFSKNLNV